MQHFPLQPLQSAWLRMAESNAAALQRPVTSRAALGTGEVAWVAASFVAHHLPTTDVREPQRVT